MVNDCFSCIKEVTKIVNLTLPSVYNSNEISGICDALESWKRQYVKQLQGVVVGYKNVSLTSKRGYLKGDCPIVYCNVKATFQLFYPIIGSIIKGKVNRVSQDHIGCLVHDTINITIDRTADLKNDISKFIVLDRFILFEITRITFKFKFIHVKGKITDQCITLMKESPAFNTIFDVCENYVQTCTSPDFSNNNSNAISNNANLQDSTGDLSISTDASSQTSLHSKKKKHKKSKKILMSPSLLNESPKHDINHIESTSAKNTRKRKRKKSDINLSSNDSETQENEIEPTQPKKKMKMEENITLINESEIYIDEMEYSENVDFPSMTLNISDPKNTNSTNTVTQHLSLKVENSINEPDNVSIVKKKKHKKSKNSLETSLPPFNESVKTEIQLSSPPSAKSKEKAENVLSSPDLFDEAVEKSIVKKDIQHKKKKKRKDGNSGKSKDKKHKKKKEKLKKGSKKDKKKNSKVISTKKKLHGYKSKLKNKDKHKKSKLSKEKKSKNKKLKHV